MKKALKTISLILVVMCLLSMLTACVPSQPGNAKQRLDDKGYKTSIQVIKNHYYSNGEPIDIGYGVGCKYIVTGEKGLDKVAIYYFEKAKYASNYYKQCKDDASYLGVSSLYVIKKSGKKVIIATEQGYKDVNQAVS